MTNDEFFDCLMEYAKLYPNDDFGLFEPSDLMYIASGDKIVISSYQETKSGFMKMLERCKTEGRNVFLEEWDEYVYDDDEEI